MGDVNSREFQNNNNSNTSKQNISKQKKDDGLIIDPDSEKESSTPNNNTPVRRKRLYKDERDGEFNPESTKPLPPSELRFDDGDHISTKHQFGNSNNSFGTISSTSSTPIPISTTSTSSNNANTSDMNRGSPLPTVFIDPNTQAEYLLHKIRPKDTLQGLALKYGVQATEIKKINKMWTGDDIFSRKEIMIPTTLEIFLKHQSSIPQSYQTSQPPKFEKRMDLMKKFSEIANCDEKIAKYFLEAKNYNFTKALGMYFTEQENKTLDIEEIKKKYEEKEKEDERLRERAVVIQSIKPDGFVELDDDLGIYTEEEAKARQQLGVTTILPTHVIAGPAHLTHVKKRVQEQLDEAEERMFDL